MDDCAVDQLAVCRCWLCDRFTLAAPGGAAVSYRSAEDATTVVAEAACATVTGAANQRGRFEFCIARSISADDHFGVATGQRCYPSRRAFAAFSEQRHGDARWVARWAWRRSGWAASACVRGLGENLHKTISVSSGVSQGLLIAPIRPAYPAIARAAHVEGTVVVEAVISRSGTIDNLHVLSGPVMLQNAAMDAIRAARYRPYRLNGEAVDVQTTITVNFRMGA
ncbi:energy transducer TonB [Tunturiibacter gelidiferens]|uniref:energy transducer TonB n=1 Tax=Tunturiibacter gelidiferens TaxID=3069689 RepID=UPI003D9BF19F